MRTFFRFRQCPVFSYCLQSLLQSTDLFSVPVSGALEQVAQHHIILSSFFTTTADRLVDPAVSITGELALACSSVGETHARVCLLSTGQNGKCQQRDGERGLLSQISKAPDKHLPGK